MRLLFFLKSEQFSLFAPRAATPAAVPPPAPERVKPPHTPIPRDAHPMTRDQLHAAGYVPWAKSPNGKAAGYRIMDWVKLGPNGFKDAQLVWEYTPIDPKSDKPRYTVTGGDHEHAAQVEDLIGIPHPQGAPATNAEALAWEKKCKHCGGDHPSSGHNAAAAALRAKAHGDRKPVEKPGSRGGLFFFDKKGDVQYGTRTTGARVATAAGAQRIEAARQHMADVINAPTSGPERVDAIEAAREAHAEVQAEAHREAAGALPQVPCSWCDGTDLDCQHCYGTGKVNQWPYEKYSDWSRQLAKDFTLPELEKRLGVAHRGREAATRSHLAAIDATHSMTSQSQRRAQTGNVVRAGYEERSALKNAIEIHAFFPEHAKATQLGDPKIAAKFRKTADGLQGQIDQLMDPGISHQNVTRRRSEIAGSMAARGFGLQTLQGVLRRLAAAHEAGTIPPVLARVGSRDTVTDLLSKYREKAPRGVINTSHFRDVVDYVKGKKVLSPEQKTRLRNLLAFGDRPDTGGIIVNDDAVIDDIGKVIRHSVANGGKTHLRRDWILQYALDWQRARDAGIDMPDKWTEARAAIRGFLADQAPDPKATIRAMERALIGRRIPGYFPTPRAASELAINAAEIGPGMSVLEPEAGKGDMAEAIREAHPDARITAVELSTDLADIVEAKGFTTHRGDFLSVTPADIGTFDRVVMNPPFEHQADIDHVRHAYEFLKPGGVLSSIMSAGAEFREDEKARDFRTWLDGLGGDMERMPDGSFKTNATTDRTTGVSTVRVVVRKPAGLMEKARAFLGVPKRTPKRDPSVEKLASDKAAVEKDLWYIDNEDLPNLGDDDPQRDTIMKARSALLGRLQALDAALILKGGRALHFQREVDGLTISVENRAGTYRYWTDHDGTAGKTKLPHHYGYAKGSLGVDGDHVDVYLGPLAHTGRVETTDVYAITTKRKPDFVEMDEQKCMVGFPDWPTAKRAFIESYGGEERFLGQVDALAWADFKREVLATAHGGGLVRGTVIAKAAALPVPAAAPEPAPVKPEAAAKSADLAGHVMTFFGPLSKTVEQLATLFPGVPVAGRLKETAALAGKLAVKDGPVDGVGDVAQARVSFETLDDAQAAVARVRRSFSVTSEDDFLSRPKTSGYRGYHFGVDVDGQPVEVQLRTDRQNRWADYSHDVAYGSHGQPADPEVAGYLKGMADYFAALDAGTEGTPPDCPPVVSEQYGELQAG